jgi:uncharacterized protein (TIGR00369 family)
LYGKQRTQKPREDLHDGLKLASGTACRAQRVAAFNRLAHFEVVAAGDGTAEIEMRWSDDLTQYFGYLHAGVIAAVLDTAYGFAASTLVGRVTASHFSMNCLRPAVGRRFVAKGATLRAGRKQVFAIAELFAENAQNQRALVATGQTILVPLEQGSLER